MAVTLRFFDAASKYGLGDMAPTQAIAISQDAIVGPYSNSPSVTENGTVATVRTVSANNFAYTTTINFVSTTTASITGISMQKGGETLFEGSGNVTFSLSNPNALSNESYIFSEADVIFGNSFNNILKGYGGNDRIDGGAGTDSAYFSGFRSQYQITRSGTSIT